MLRKKGFFFNCTEKQNLLLTNLDPSKTLASIVTVKLAVESMSAPKLHVLQPSEFMMAFGKCGRSVVKVFLTTANFCRRDNFDITLVKVIVTPTNVFNIFQALSRRHSRSIAT